MMISIVIPTLLKSETLLQKCLNSVHDQSHPQSEIEVILVANTDWASLTKFVSKLPNYKFNFKHTALDANLGFAAATNAGINLATGKFILTLNDDAWLNRSFVQEILATQVETKADMVAATIYLNGTDQIDSCGFDFSWRGQAWPLTPQPQGLKSPLTSYSDNWLKNPQFLPVQLSQQPFGPDAAVAIYSRKLIDQVGCFDESFFAYLEDVDLALRARKHGMFCVWSSKSIAHHEKHATSRKMGKFKKQQDVKNWWRIVLKYSPNIWAQYLPLILIERGRNLIGYFKR